MTLDQWMTQMGLSEVAMAALLGTSQSTISRYLSGERMPKPRIMTKIVAVTAGRVRPDDFYGLKPHRPRKRKSSN